MNRRALAASTLCGCLGLACLEVYKRRLVVETSGGDPISVLIVTRDVAADTTLARELLGVRSVPEAYVEGRQIKESELDKVLGIAAGLRLKAGESLLWTDLAPARPDDAALSSLVQPGMRAIVVHASAFDGLLRPGDRVDVITAGGDGSGSSSPLVQDLVVLAIGNYTGVDGSRPPNGGTDRVTLTGSSEQAALIAGAAARSSLALALRNPDDRAVMVPDDPISTLALRAHAPAPAGSIDHVR